MEPEPQAPEPKRRRVNFDPALLREPRTLAIGAFVLGLILGPVVVAMTLALIEMVRQSGQPPAETLRADTVLDVCGQLLSERVAPARRVRRRTYQALLSFDLFYKQLARTRPSLRLDGSAGSALKCAKLSPSRRSRPASVPTHRRSLRSRYKA